MKKEPFFTTSGIWLKDRDGRTVMPRGCNLGAGGKVPVIPRGETWIKESLSLGVSGSENISFAGTPFPLEECSFHFKQLKKIVELSGTKIERGVFEYFEKLPNMNIEVDTLMYSG